MDFLYGDHWKWSWWPVPRKLYWVADHWWDFLCWKTEYQLGQQKPWRRPASEDIWQGYLSKALRHVPGLRLDWLWLSLQVTWHWWLQLLFLWGWFLLAGGIVLGILWISDRCQHSAVDICPAWTCTWWGEGTDPKLKLYLKHAPGWDDAIDPAFFVSSLYISVPINVRFLKSNTFNRYKNNISKPVLVFL